MNSQDDQLDLTSWKEIAARLQVTVRTAQTWEKARGLPVRRVPGGRGRVFMKVSELEAWLDGESRHAPTEVEPAFGRHFSRPIAIFAGSLAVVVGVLAWIAQDPSLPPVQWHVVADTLVVEDEDGKELWRVSFEEDLRESEYDSPEGRDMFHDLDGDGVLETLFVARYLDMARSHVLFCFDEKGRELWNWKPGRTVSTGTETFQNVYRVGEFRVLELGGGRRGVVVAGREMFQYPTQVAVLSATDGTRFSEYWHSGQIGVRSEGLKVADYNGDGRSEIYLAGVSNARRRATLVVLDPRRMQGASLEETDEYQLREFPEPREIARVLFPRSSMSQISDPYNVAIDVHVMPETITVGVIEELTESSGPQILYELLPDFSLSKVTLSSSFMGVHDRLVREGKLTTTQEEEVEALSSVEHVGAPTPLTSRANRSSLR